jgi:hypothetical protein
LAGVLLLGLFSTEANDPDLWWHLKTGQYILTHHRLPVPDPFAYTTAGATPGYAGEEQVRRFNLTHEWLSQIAWYSILSGGGFAAVVLWKSLLLTILCGLVGLVVYRRTSSDLWGIAAALTVAWLAIDFDKDRPGILSYVFVAAFVSIFEERRKLWLLPVLSLIWANSHGGFFLGWGVCGAYGAEALLRRAPDARRLLIYSGLAILLSGVNPNGFTVISTLLRYRQSTLTATLIEWSRPDLWGPPYAFDILLYAAVAVLIVSWKRVRPADWLLFAAFSMAALTAFRNEMLVGIVAPVLIASYFPWRRPLPVLVRYGVTAALLVGIGLGLVHRSFFQLRAAEWRYPEGASNFLAANRITVSVFNTYEYGGYLIWKDQRVFIDGRALSETVFDEYRRILGSPPEDASRFGALARYGAGAIVVNAFEYNSGVLYPLVLALGRPEAADWKLVYNDAAALVFLRNPPSGMPVFDKSRIVDHLEAECFLHVERDPEFSLCARKLGDFFLRSGDRARARQALGLYLQHPYADDPEARRVYGQLLLGQ